jgi:hypothetical protein
MLSSRRAATLRCQLAGNVSGRLREELAYDRSSWDVEALGQAVTSFEAASNRSMKRAIDAGIVGPRL